MPETSQKKEELIITRVFDVPRELVWAAWTEPEQLKKWWGPRGFTSPFSRIDLRVGGKYLHCMRGPDGKDYWSTGVYREVVSPKRLAMTDSFADEEGNVVSATYYGLDPEFPRELQVIVELDEKEGRKTRLTLKHGSIKNLNETDVANMEQGWNESFDKLAECLGTSERKRRSPA
ncbi:MAG: SRPBCC family protein [Halobacteriota archaeon]